MTRAPGGEGEGEVDAGPIIDPECTPDGDGDGICDSQEEEIGTDPTPIATATASTTAMKSPGARAPLDSDSDGDGIPDGDEEELGTDPTIPDQACVAASAEASVGDPGLVDIIIAIDTSGSMQGEIDAVEANISASFADIIGQSGIDFRVILLADYPPGPKLTMCVTAPLSTADCVDPLPTAPGTRFPTFFHYDTLVDSHDAYQVLLESFITADPTTRCRLAGVLCCAKKRQRPSSSSPTTTRREWTSSSSTTRCSPWPPNISAPRAPATTCGTPSSAWPKTAPQRPRGSPLTPCKQASALRARRMRIGRIGPLFGSGPAEQPARSPGTMSAFAAKCFEGNPPRGHSFLINVVPGTPSRDWLAG